MELAKSILLLMSPAELHLMNRVLTHTREKVKKRAINEKKRKYKLDQEEEKKVEEQEAELRRNILKSARHIYAVGEIPSFKNKFDGINDEYLDTPWWAGYEREDVVAIDCEMVTKLDDFGIYRSVAVTGDL